MFHSLHTSSMNNEPNNLQEIDPKAVQSQLKRLKNTKTNRNNEMVKNCLKQLKEAATNGVNVMPHIVSAVKAYATLGEISNTLRQVFGEHQ